MTARSRWLRLAKGEVERATTGVTSVSGLKVTLEMRGQTTNGGCFPYAGMDIPKREVRAGLGPHDIIRGMYDNSSYV